MHEMNNKLVALLPMKAHSERIKGKNFKQLAGRPLFKWILDTLLSISQIEKVVINTDASDILMDHGIVESDKITIRKRKQTLCGDYVSMNHILRDDIENVSANIYLMTHTTNPFLSKASIISALEKYENAQNCDSLFSVTKYQTRFYRQDGTAINHDPCNLIRTQDLEPWYEENSNLYLFTRESFLKTKARIGERPIMFETPKIESTDIDDSEDWQIASAIAEYLSARER